MEEFSWELVSLLSVDPIGGFDGLLFADWLELAQLETKSIISKIISRKVSLNNEQTPCIAFSLAKKSES